MVHAACYLREKRSKRNEVFFCNTNPQDWPLIVQLCGNDPGVLLAAAKEICRIEGVCAVDLNLGCPQGIARKGKYGAFLLHQADLVVRIVSTLSRELDKPVTCKIRLLPTFSDTLALCQALVGAGCSLLTVHGRTKEQNKHLVGSCDWEAIRKIKAAVPIPVFANGGIADLDDVEKCLSFTKVDGVMSSEALLENPGLFSRNVNVVTGHRANQLDLAEEYLELAAQHPPDRLKCVRAHVFKLVFTGVQLFEDLRDALVAAENVKEMRWVVGEIRRRALERAQGRDVGSAGERSWYWRHWHKGETDKGSELPRQGKEGGKRRGEEGGVESEGMGCLFGAED